MQRQGSFAQAEYAGKKKQTRRDKFLADMEQVVPWARLVERLRPFYPKRERSRPPTGLERMLRIYFLQQWYALADEALEDALYDSQALRGFACIDLTVEAVPDATTVLHFRHWLEQHGLTKVLFDEVGAMPMPPSSPRRFRPRTRARAATRRRLLGLMDNGDRAQQACRSDADRVDAQPGQEARDLRIIRRRLATDPDMAMVALGAGDREPQHFEHTGVALVEVEGDDFRVAVDAQSQLRQIVRADREPVKQLGEGVDFDDVVRDLAHDVDLEPLGAALDPVLRHRLDDRFAFCDAAAERDHDAKVGQPHFVAHPRQCGAFERKSGGIGRVGIARRSAEPEHRVVLLGLEPGAAEEARIFVGLEVR
jgi:Transposase domain (DUF772)